MLETSQKHTQTSFTNSRPLVLSDIGYTITEDILHYFGLNGIRYIAEIEAPEIFNEIQTFNHIHEISELIDSKTDIPSGFFETLNLIYMLRGSATFSFFDQQNIIRNENECDGELLCRILSNDRVLFTKLVKQVEGRIQSDGTSFSVARLKKLSIKEKGFFKDKEAFLEDECKSYYRDQGYTDNCNLRVININGREGLRIERGSHVNHLAVFENSERLTRQAVLRKVDLIFIDNDTQTIWVYAKGQRPRDIAFYQMMVTRALTGNAEAFENLTLNFKFIKDKSLKKKLDMPRRFAERVILRKAHFPHQLDSCISSPLRTSSIRKECLTDKKDFLYNVENISSFTGAELKILINEDESIFDLITIGAGRIESGGILSLENIFELLLDLGIIERVYNA